MTQAAQIYELHINPTYAVYLPQRSKGGNTKSSARIANEVNLLNNDNAGKVSRKAARRLANSVNWLVASARTKYVYDKISGKRFSFKVNFVTLTLPAPTQEISDHHFKSKLLHAFINTCRSSFDLKNYIWKVEAQENGNIHAHFTTDTFIHWKDLRRVWNRILIKHGLMDTYTNKHKDLTFDQYCDMYNPEGKTSIERLQKSFDFGCSTNWQDPNTTDVHSVWSVKDLAAYLAKYMTKSEEDRRQIKGRLWSCSYNLSASNKLVLELHGSHDQDLLESFFDQRIKYVPIEGIDKLTSKPFRIGELFLYKLTDWGNVIKGRVLNSYNEHRFNIRHNVDIQALKTSSVNHNQAVKILNVVLPDNYKELDQNHSNQLTYIYENNSKKVRRQSGKESNFRSHERFRKGLAGIKKFLSISGSLSKNACGFNFGSRQLVRDYSRIRRGRKYGGFRLQTGS